MPLAGEGEPGALSGARLVFPDDEVVSVTVGGEPSIGDLGNQEPRLGGEGQLVAQVRADTGAEFLVGFAILGAELPLIAEQGRLVEVGGDLVDGDALGDLGAESRRLRDRVVRHH